MSQQSNTPRLAYLGLGIMGSAMTINMSKAGFEVVGWNRTFESASAQSVRDFGISVVKEVQDAISDADVIFSCLGDVPDVEQILLGPVKETAKKNAVVVDMTTIGKAAAVHIDHVLRESNLRFLDAPVTGGDIGARQGTLTILVGGERDVFDEVLPVFQAIGKTIVHCGKVGDGQALKLCNQVLCAINMLAVSETFSLADEMKIDKSLILSSLAGGAGASWALSNLGARIIKGDFEPGFTLEHMLKDLRLIEENTDGCDLPAVDLARQFFKQAAEVEGTSGYRQGTQAMYRAYRTAKKEPWLGA